ncbi:MAG TPA: hypothetical protein PLU35_05540 [Phycisphaerales bacterium]|nr:hypothetical protein [Phycisphaerales bacterium]
MSHAALSTRVRAGSWVLQVIVAIILGQTLFFKFSGAEEAVHIFSTLGVEPWGRYATAFAELATVVLLLVPRLAVYGALLGLGVIAGAIVSHLTVLGIEVADDGGLLFAMALIVFAACATIVALRRAQLPIIGARFTRGSSAGT